MFKVNVDAASKKTEQNRLTLLFTVNNKFSIKFPHQCYYH